MANAVYRSRKRQLLVGQDVGHHLHGHLLAVLRFLAEHLTYPAEDARQTVHYPSFDGHAVACDIVVVGNRVAGVFLWVVGQAPAINETAVILLATDGDGSFAVLLRAEADVEFVQAIIGLNSVRPVAFVLRSDVPRLTVVEHLILRQSNQPIACLVVAPIGVRDAVAAAGTEDRQQYG